MYTLIATTVCGVIMMAVGAFVTEKKGVATMAALLLLLLTGVNAYEAVTIGEGRDLFGGALHIDK